MNHVSPRIAVVTGAARGIGLAVAQRLSADGLRVALVDRDEAELAKVATMLPAARIACVTADLADPEAPRTIAQEVARLLGTPTILVNNAGIAPKHDGRAWSVTETSLEEWQRVMNVNLTSAMLMCQALLPGMQKEGFGRVVNVSSSAGRTAAVLNGPSYMCSKAGMLALSRHVAQHYGKDGITSNTVALGRVITPLALLWTLEQEEAYNKRNPVGRSGRAEEVADAVAYFVGELAGFTNGTVLDINGGAFMA
ncbi:SDR family NAD(P)-dependent oxidoreductase [Variovorax sp. J31P207]|uniref:SDR family NAD(P)-dependent oxidoreductase n=1 Tax=Variovorax sp. J31P207 TaxID=3053510 RepID=UPI00257532EB|nr:SDR family NAD(P)-dependent oxidoreductase [Variovorax sp. J31P207]MDM0071431.1 SDR family NAD(P)-dependent oxidoreductase [Variovorax sp. J31P207]